MAMNRTARRNVAAMQAKEEAISLLDRCLTAHEGISEEEHESFVLQVAEALDMREGSMQVVTESVGERKMKKRKELELLSLRLQGRLAAGLSAGNEEDLVKVEKKDEIVVTKSGKRYAVRKTAKGQIVEVARCDSIDEALHALMVELASGSTNKRKLDGGEGAWCKGCLDDDSIEICVFCGCRKCFGKHDSANILVCDGCEDEWHIYCLNPPLSAVPKSSEWHCQKCIARREKIPRPRGRPPGQGNASRANSEEKIKQARANTQAESTVDPNAPKPRGRGRPKGSGTKKHKEGAASASPQGGAKVGPSFSSSGANAQGNRDEKPANVASSQIKEPANLPLDAVGIEAALAVIGRAGFGKGLATSELDLLKQLRIWGPYSDLSTARDAALQQRDVLKRKLSSISQ